MHEDRFDLSSIGFDHFFSESFEPFIQKGCIPGRVARQDRGAYTIWTELGELSGSLSGKLRHDSFNGQQLPVAGDWVAVRPRYEEGGSTIVAVLPRKSQFMRGAAGPRPEGQIVAANVDSVFLMMAMDRDFNPRRIERYLVMAWQSGAQPVVLLSKSDLCPEPLERSREIEALAPGAPVHVTSVVNETGLQALCGYLEPGQTVALLGSSGVGKSTLINYLAGRTVQRTGDVRRHDGRGRHTTTSRELILLPGGGLVLDTPGMRELQLWDVSDSSTDGSPGPDRSAGFDRTFGDIESLASRCYYRDCSHRNEPDCAVQAALAENLLEQERFRSYQKLQKELRYQERRQDKALEIREKNKWKKLCRLAKEKSATKRRG